MPLQNRVLPTGDIVAIAARGTMLGNRGILHDANKTLGTRRWQHQNWVCCVRAFKGRKREIMAPRRYTELFFLDEAVAFAAGHRPCGECRRKAYAAFRSGWATAYGDAAGPKEIDKILHKARVTRNRQQLRYEARCADLPDGTFILHDDQPHLIWGDHLFAYSPRGYAAPIPRPRPTTLQVLTPRPTVRVMQAGYRPDVHPSAPIDLSAPTA